MFSDSVLVSDPLLGLPLTQSGSSCRLPGEHMAPGCTMGRRRAGGGSVMLWTMFCWGTLGSTIHVDVPLTRSTYLSLVADHEQTQCSLMASFSRMMLPATKQKWFRNGLRNTTTSLRCCLGLQVPQTSIRSSICGTFWTNKSDPWRPHLTTYRT